MEANRWTVFAIKSLLFTGKAENSLNESLLLTHLDHLFFVVVNTGRTMKEKLLMNLILPSRIPERTDGN